MFRVAFKSESFTPVQFNESIQSLAVHIKLFYITDDQQLFESNLNFEDKKEWSSPVASEQHQERATRSKRQKLSQPVIMKSLACTETHLYCVMRDGSLYVSPLTSENWERVNFPWINEQVDSLVTGDRFCLVLTRSRKLYAWGDNAQGQCGVDSDVFYFAEPQLISSLIHESIRMIAARGRHAAALTDQGIVYAWGCNQFGQLGLGDIEPRRVPTKTATEASNPIEMVVCGMNHLLWVTKPGELCGTGWYGHKDYTVQKFQWLIREPVISLATGKAWSFIQTEEHIYILNSLGFNVQLHYRVDWKQSPMKMLCAQDQFVYLWESEYDKEAELGDVITDGLQFSSRNLLLQLYRNNNSLLMEHYGNLNYVVILARIQELLAETVRIQIPLTCTVSILLLQCPFLTSEMQKEILYFTESSLSDLVIMRSWTESEQLKFIQQLQSVLSQLLIERAYVHVPFVSMQLHPVLLIAIEWLTEIKNMKIVNPHNFINNTITTKMDIKMDYFMSQRWHRQCPVTFQAAFKKTWKCQWPVKALFFSQLPWLLELDVKRQLFVLETHFLQLHRHTNPDLNESNDNNNNTDSNSNNNANYNANNPRTTRSLPTEATSTFIQPTAEHLQVIREAMTDSSRSAAARTNPTATSPPIMRRLLDSLWPTISGVIERMRGTQSNQNNSNNNEVTTNNNENNEDSNAENNEDSNTENNQSNPSNSSHTLFYPIPNQGWMSVRILFEPLGDAAFPLGHVANVIIDLRGGEGEHAESNEAETNDIRAGIANNFAEMTSESAIEMEDHSNSSLWHLLLQHWLRSNLFSNSNGNTESNQPLSQVIQVKRNNLLNDILTLSEPLERKPLKIVFKGEEALDVGGVAREFYALLCQNLCFNENVFCKVMDDYKLGEEKQLESFIWLKEDTPKETPFLRLGQLVALAICNGHLLSLPFPKFVFKCLLSSNYEIQWEDVEEFDAIWVQSMKTLNEETYLEFVDYFEEESAEMHPSLQTFIKKALYEKCFGKVRWQWKAFYQGFHEILKGSYYFPFLSVTDLEHWLSGTHDTFQEDWWLELRSVTRYKNGYHSEHPTILSFWQTCQHWTRHETMLFLMFMTGTRRLPLRGWKSLPLIIQQSGQDQDRLPVAHTCFCTLDLPVYERCETLREKLLFAIENTRGFGLV